jgi:hypothetical protein
MGNSNDGAGNGSGTGGTAANRGGGTAVNERNIGKQASDSRCKGTIDANVKFAMDGRVNGLQRRMRGGNVSGKGVTSEERESVVERGKAKGATTSTIVKSGTKFINR